MTFSINILTLFPESYPGLLGVSVLGRALTKGAFTLNVRNIRDYALDKHKVVDDTPFGGGNGMVLKPDVIGYAIEDFFIPNGFEIIYLSPRGTVFKQKLAKELSTLQGLNIICGRFEGLDERVILRYKIYEVSLGDFVVSSGDAACIPFLDAILREVPGVLAQSNALAEESFAVGSEYEFLLEYPHYTKPAQWHGLNVPETLLSGNHAAIKKWRLNAAIEKTRATRPDLLDQYSSINGDKK